MKRYLLFILVLFPYIIFAQLPGENLPKVSELSTKTYDTLQVNQVYYFVGTEKKEWNDACLVVKFGGKLDNIIQELTWFHQTQPKHAQKDALESYTWERVLSPHWFYAYADFFLEAKRHEKQWVLTYNFFYSKENNLHKNRNLLGMETISDAYGAFQDRISYAASGYPIFHPFRPFPETNSQLITSKQQEDWNLPTFHQVSFPTKTNIPNSPNTEVEQFILGNTLVERKSYKISVTVKNTSLWKESMKTAEPWASYYYKRQNGTLVEHGFHSIYATSVNKIYRPDEYTSVNANYAKQGDQLSLPNFYLNHFQPGTAYGFPTYPLLDTTIAYPGKPYWQNEETPLDALLEAAANWNTMDPRKPDTLWHEWHDGGRFAHLTGFAPPGTTPRIIYQPLMEQEWENWLKGYEENQHEFHQIWMNDLPMEDYITQKLGNTPSMLLFEIYQYGVIAFGLEPQTRKYHYFKTIILE